MMSQIFVSGHKSPDTDSIAAALSYSYLKRRLGMDAVAVRAGEIPNNPATKAIKNSLLELLLLLLKSQVIHIQTLLRLSFF